MTTRTLSYYSLFKLVDAYANQLFYRQKKHLKKLMSNSEETEPNQLLTDILLRYYTRPISNSISQRVIDGFDLSLAQGFSLRRFLVLAARELRIERSDEDLFASLDFRDSRFAIAAKNDNHPIGLGQHENQDLPHPTDFEAKMLERTEIRTIYKFLVSVLAYRKLKAMNEAAGPSDFLTLELPDNLIGIDIRPELLSTKIEWLGQENQLSELLLELYKKGFIPSIDPPVIKVIQAVFTRTESLLVIMKPAQDPKTKEKTYEKGYPAKRNRKFDLIKPNTRSTKTS